MCLVQQNHAQAALTNTAAHRKGQLVVEQSAVEVERCAVFLALKLKLALQCLAVYADAHRRQLERALQHRIPYKDVAVKSGLAILGNSRPVVVVGGASVVLLAVGKLAADANDEHSSILLADGVLALLGAEVWIHGQQILAVYKVDILGQEWSNLLVGLAHQVFCASDGCINALNHIL